MNDERIAITTNLVRTKGATYLALVLKQIQFDKSESLESNHKVFDQFTTEMIDYFAETFDKYSIRVGQVSLLDKPTLSDDDLADYLIDSIILEKLEEYGWVYNDEHDSNYKGLVLETIVLYRHDEIKSIWSHTLDNTALVNIDCHYNQIGKVVRETEDHVGCVYSFENNVDTDNILASGVLISQKLFLTSNAYAIPKIVKINLERYQYGSSHHKSRIAILVFADSNIAIFRMKFPKIKCARLVSRQSAETTRSFSIYYTQDLSHWSKQVTKRASVIDHHVGAIVSYPVFASDGSVVSIDSCVDGQLKSVSIKQVVTALAKNGILL